MRMHHTIITDETADPMPGYLFAADVVGGEGTTVRLTDGHQWADGTEREVVTMLTAREMVLLAKWLLDVAEAQIVADDQRAREVAAEAQA